MTVLNRASDGLMSVLLALHRAIATFGPKSESELIALVAPPAMLSDAKPEKAKQTLARWIQLGFFCGGKSEPVRMSDGLEDLNPSDLQGIRVAVLRLIFSKKNNSSLVSDEDDNKGEFTGASDLTRALVWMLIQDPFTFPYSYDDAEPLQSKQRIEPKPFVNDTRWSAFEEWSVFLGMAIKPGGRLTPNPALALSCFLSEVIHGQSELTQAAFLERLAASLPVLEGGYLHGAVEKEMKNPPRVMAQTEVSPSLSMALLTLEAQQLLRLEMRSDAPSRALLGAQYQPFRSFSHVSFGGQK
jgi:hypothetical protein